MDIVLGSSGFIGSNLAKYLSTKYGKNSIIRISKSNKGLKTKKNFYEIDLKDRKKLINLKLKDINKVYICAGVSKTFIKRKLEGKKQIEDNKNILKNIILFCKKNKVKNIIFLSSSAVYSSFNKYPLSEKQKIKPNSYLGISKKINENQLERFSKISNIKILVLRIFTVYGNGMRKDQFIYQIIKKIKNNKKVVLWNPETFRNFIYIDDLVKLIDVLGSKNKKRYDIINVATFKSFKIKYIFDQLSRILKKNKNLKLVSNNNNFNHFVEINKLKKIIKNFKFTKIVDGLKRIK